VAAELLDAALVSVRQQPDAEPERPVSVQQPPDAVPELLDAVPERSGGAPEQADARRWHPHYPTGRPG
jgi:hypothetical protein